MLSAETVERLAGHQVCAAVSGGKDSAAMSLYTFKGERCFLWGCELFDNEADARRRFG